MSTTFPSGLGALSSFTPAGIAADLAGATLADSGPISQTTDTGAITVGGIERGGADENSALLIAGAIAFVGVALLARKRR